jgi:hypothetical protein
MARLQRSAEAAMSSLGAASTTPVSSKSGGKKKKKAQKKKEKKIAEAVETKPKTSQADGTVEGTTDCSPTKEKLEEEVDGDGAGMEHDVRIVLSLSISFDLTTPPHCS